MKNNKIVPILIVLLMISVIVFSANEVKKIKYKKSVGKEIIIEKDTLTIVGYSTWKGNFTLESGIKIDFNKTNL